MAGRAEDAGADLRTTAARISQDPLARRPAVVITISAWACRPTFSRSSRSTAAAATWTAASRASSAPTWPQVRSLPNETAKRERSPLHPIYPLVDDFALPNGLAFSPDESVLYVDDSAHKHIRAFSVRPDGSLTGSRILLDMASADPGVPDGLKVDRQGNVFCTGPGGVWVCRADGALLGRIVLPELPANLAWGEDGSVLFLTARTSVYRLQTRTRGALLTS